MTEIVVNGDLIVKLAGSLTVEEPPAEPPVEPPAEPPVEPPDEPDDPTAPEPPTEEPPDDQPSPDEPPEPPADEITTTFALKSTNPKAGEFVGEAFVPFKKGEVASLTGWGVENTPSIIEPVIHYDDGSVRFARVTVTDHFGAMGTGSYRLISEAGESSTDQPDLDDVRFEMTDHKGRAFVYHPLTDLTLEASGSAGTVWKAHQDTVFHAPDHIEPGWCARIYYMLGRIKIEFQIRNTAVGDDSKQCRRSHVLAFQSARLVFPCEGNKSEGLIQISPRDPTRHKGIMRQGETTLFVPHFWERSPAQITAVPGELVADIYPEFGAMQAKYTRKRGQEWQTNGFPPHPSGLYWLWDLEAALWTFCLTKGPVDEEAIYHDLRWPIVPEVNYVDTGALPATWNGEIPVSAIDDKRRLLYSDDVNPKQDQTYWLGKNNFPPVKNPKRRYSTANTGGWKRGGLQYLASNDTADWYGALYNAMGDLRRPYWMPDGWKYRHPEGRPLYRKADHYAAQMGFTPYPGAFARGIVRSDKYRHPSGLSAKHFIPDIYRDWATHDNEHAWLTHMLDAFLLTGNRWLHDLWQSHAQFVISSICKYACKERDTYYGLKWSKGNWRLGELYAGQGGRSLGHPLDLAVNAYIVTLDPNLLNALDDRLTMLLHRQAQSWVEEGYESGYLCAPLCLLYYECEELREKCWAVIDLITHKNLERGNFNYRWQTGNSKGRNYLKPDEVAQSRSETFTMIDVQAMASHEHRKRGNTEHADALWQQIEDYRSGKLGKPPINGAGPGREWTGEWYGRFAPLLEG